MQWSEFSFILKPSLLSSLDIGVFATHDIAAGTLLVDKGHKIRILKIKDIPAEFIKYCTFINDDECVVPERFDRMEIGWFIHHSDVPNIASNESVFKDFDIRNGVIPAYSFYAIKDIKAGDEILIDYNYLNEPEHLKDDYYKKS